MYTPNPGPTLPPTLILLPTNENVALQAARLVWLSASPLAPLIGTLIHPVAMTEEALKGAERSESEEEFEGDETFCEEMEEEAEMEGQA